MNLLHCCEPLHSWAKRQKPAKNIFILCDITNFSCQCLLISIISVSGDYLRFCAPPDSWPNYIKPEKNQIKIVKLTGHTFEGSPSTKCKLLLIAVRHSYLGQMTQTEMM